MDRIRGTALLHLGDLLADLGGSLRHYLESQQIALDVPGNFEKNLPYDSLAKILQQASEDLAAPHLGLELAKRQGSTAFGPLQHLARSAATLGDALIALLRYMPLYSPATYRLDRRTGCVVLHIAPPSRLAEQPQILESALLQSKLLIDELLGKSWHPEGVQLNHSSQAAAELYQDYFDCPVLFDQPSNGLSFPIKMLSRPCVQQDSTLHTALRHYLEALSSEESLSRQVERCIQMLLPGCRCNLQRVSSALGIHPRTLQRRLANDGIDFEEHLEQVRRRQARQLLCHTTLSISQIARELGYNRTTSFCRAHLRWHAISPLEYRYLHGNSVSQNAGDLDD